MKGKRHRLWEGVKSLLILLLSCSAVYLAGRTLFPQESGGFLSRLPQSGSVPTQSTQSVLLSQVLRPATLAVTWEEGRYGLLQHQEDQEVYTQLTALLAEALNSAQAPDQTDRRSWEHALAQPGFFFEYLGPIPLDALTRWLSQQDNAALSGVQAQRLCVTAQTLYVSDGSEGYYACPLTTDLAPALEELTAGLSPNGARFAGNLSGFRHLHPDSLILALTPQLPQLSAADPIPLSDAADPGETLSMLLQALSFHPQTNPLYAVTGGYAITDGGETLRISASGELTYRRSGEDTPRFPAGGQPLDATLALAESTVGAVCGDARIYLKDIQTQGQTTLITYGYAYRGAAIQLEREGWCAQFTVEDDAITAFVLRPRLYTVQGDTPILLLPQEQAAAALSPGQEQILAPLYEDSAGAQLLTPFWAAWTAGR